MTETQPSSPPEAQDPRAIRSREALMRAAAALLRERPASEITATDVVRAADVSRPTLYQHFGDLTSLYVETARERLQVLFVDTLPKATPLGEAADLANIRHLLDSLRTDSTFFLHATRGPGGYEVAQSLTEVLTGRLRSHSPLRYLEENPETPDHYLEFLSHGTVGLVASWLASDFTGPNSVDSMTQRIVALLSCHLHQVAPGTQPGPAASNISPKEVA